MNFCKLFSILLLAGAVHARGFDKDLTFRIEVIEDGELSGDNVIRNLSTKYRAVKPANVKGGVKGVTGPRRNGTRGRKLKGSKGDDDVGDDAVGDDATGGKSGKNKSKGGGSASAVFIYDQDGDDAVVENIVGDVLSFTKEGGGLCTRDLCRGSTVALLEGQESLDGVFLAVNLASLSTTTLWEFSCPSVLQESSLVDEECLCSGTDTGTCMFEALDGGSNFIITTAGDCVEGVQGTVLVECVDLEL